MSTGTTKKSKIATAHLKFRTVMNANILNSSVHYEPASGQGVEILLIGLYFQKVRNIMADNDLRSGGGSEELSIWTLRERDKPSPWEISQWLAGALGTL